RLHRATAARRILVVVPARPERRAMVEALRGPLRSARHDVVLRLEPPAGRTRLRVIDDVVAEEAADPRGFDALLVVDDDVALVPRFLDRFVALVLAAGLDLAQPAHRRHGHAAWPVT